MLVHDQWEGYTRNQCSDAAMAASVSRDLLYSPDACAQLPFFHIPADTVLSGPGEHSSATGQVGLPGSGG